VFLDGVLIYSKLEEEHEDHLRLVLQVIREHQRYADLSAYFIKGKFIIWDTSFPRKEWQ
jgi:hypothetical protein